MQDIEDACSRDQDQQSAFCIHTVCIEQLTRQQASHTKVKPSNTTELQRQLSP